MPEPIVIKQFHHKEGAEKVLFSQLAAFALVKTFSSYSLFCSSSTGTHQTPCIEKGDSSSLFCVDKSNFHLEQRLITPVKLSRGSSSFLYGNYGSLNADIRTPNTEVL